MPDNKKTPDDEEENTQDENTPAADPKAAKAQLKAEKKKLKEDQKQQKKDAKNRQRELEDREAEINGDDEGGGFATALITILIILMWLIIMALLVKLDVGGFGSTVLTPILKDVPYVNKILPDTTSAGTGSSQSGNSASDGSMVSGNSTQTGGADAAYVQKLELQLQDAQSKNSTYEASIAQLQAEVDRLKPFEDEQDKLESERQQFYKDIVYNDNAPDAASYASYYAMIEPDIAASIYQGVLEGQQSDEEVKKYAAAYSAMKAKQAAAIFNKMDDLTLVARILNQMSSDDRGAILGAMDATVADEVTKLMAPSALPELSGSSNNAGSGK
ncbi:MAG: hypothetical protein LKF52_13860 [Butyrivibrio sp.]|jgi:flagellar motility protein MotE (MotC chaperone)|nr:hypothetical protein [Butyrivibrio sp.]